MNKLVKLAAIGVGATLTLVILPGCKKQEEIHSYYAPHDTPAPAVADSNDNAQAPQPASGATANELGFPADLRWTLPDGWKQVPVPSNSPFSPVVAQFQVAADQPGLVLTVSQLPDSPGARSIMDNLSRWAGQLKMPAPTETDLNKYVEEWHLTEAFVERSANPLGPARPARPSAHIDLSFITMGGTTPSQPKLLAAILPHEHDTWVFKLLGDSAAVDGKRGAFTDFLNSLRFDQSAPSPSPTIAGPPIPAPAAAPSDSSATGAGGAHWALPAGWTADAAESNQFRVATIRPGNGSAQIKVSKLGSIGGGLGMNVSRWRGEVGLPPVDDAHADGGKEVKVGDQTWTVHDYSGPANGGTREIVAVAETSDGTWYFKFVGPSDEIEKQKPNFDEFLSTIRLGN